MTEAQAIQSKLNELSKAFSDLNEEAMKLKLDDQNEPMSNAGYHAESGARAQAINEELEAIHELKVTLSIELSRLLDA